MSKKLLPIAAMGKLMKDNGADRVSNPAKKALKEELEIIAKDISLKAVIYANHAGRRTVKSSDIRLAAK
jgi:DNA-binding protein